MGQDELALKKSLESGDYELIYSTLCHLQSKYNVIQFFKILKKFPDAIRPFELLFKEKDIEVLKAFYYQDDRLTDTFLLLTEEAFKEQVSLPKA